MGDGEVTFGGGGDSMYEYLIKGWVQGGCKEGKLLEVYYASVSALESLIGSTRGPDVLTYLGTSSQRGKMEHLTCFVPGMLALGSKYIAKCGASDHAVRATAHLALAEKLMRTCYEMYRKTPTGLGPEEANFDQGEFKVAEGAPWTVLRPETVESLYVLYQVTKDKKYQDWGWAIFAAMEKFCKTTYGFGAFPDVRNPTAKCCQGPDDRTETFFFAETLKYLYLL